MAMNPAAPAKRPAVFIDKDGTLVHDVPYNVDLADIRIRADAFAALRLLSAEGYRIVIVTNQSGVALGLFSEDAVGRVREHLRGELGRHGVELDGFYYCPHPPADPGSGGGPPCQCRKPLPGMLLTAARELNLDLKASWMIGDILDDVEAGTLAGCRTILLDVGNETEWRAGAARIPDGRAGTLMEAALLIVRAGVPAHRITVIAGGQSDEE